MLNSVNTTNEKINRLIDDRTEELSELKENISQLENLLTKEGRVSKQFDFSRKCIEQDEVLRKSYYEVFVEFFIEDIMCFASSVKVLVQQKNNVTKEWTILKNHNLLDEGEMIQEMWDTLDNLHLVNNIKTINLYWED
jgi:hypothetical protein